MNKYWKELGIAAVMGLLVPSILLAAVVALAKNEPEEPAREKQPL